MPTITNRPTLPVIASPVNGCERSPGEIRREGMKRQLRNEEAVLESKSYLAKRVANRSAEGAVLEMLHKAGPCCLDDLVMKLPEFSWSQVFLAVDRMSRHGRLLLRRLRYSSYHVALATRQTSLRSPLHTEGAIT
jgi:hypothetical protein